MATINSVQKGVLNFIDTELLAKVTGAQAWILGTVAGIAIGKSSDIFEAAKKNPAVKALGIIDSDNNIDIDMIMQHLKSTAKKAGDMKIDIPLIGKLTFTEKDVEKLHELIQSNT